MASKKNQVSVKSWGGARPGAGRKKSLPTNASYEGSWRYNPQRAWIYTTGVDAKKELASGTRYELQRKALWLYNNIGLAKGAVDKVAALVGPLKPQARTSDDKWNRMAEEAFHDATSWAPGVDVAGSVNFSQVPRLLVSQMAIAGDVFWQRTLSSSGRGMFRLIGGEHVGSGNATEADGWQDGIRVNEYGKPLEVRVLKTPRNYEEFIDIDAGQINRVGRAYRVGYTRSPSWFAPSLNHFQDYSESLSYEKTSQKIGAQMAFVVTSPEAGNLAFGAGPLNQGQTGSSPTNTYTLDSMMNSSVIPQLKPGEKIESFANNHPSPNFKNFLEVLMTDIACGFGCSKEFLFDMDTGGAGVRWALEEASVMIKGIQDILIHSFAAPFWKFWVWQEIEAGRLPMPGNGSDWYKCSWTPGQGDLSVDFGRDGRLMSDLLLRGQISPQRYYALQGLDSDKQDEDIIRAAARRKKMIAEIAKEEGVELTAQEIFPPAPGSPIPAQTVPQGE